MQYTNGAGRGHEASQRLDGSTRADGALHAGTDELLKNAENVAQDMQQKAEATLNDVGAYIRSKPIQSAVIAAGIGFLFAIVTRK